MAHNSLNVGLHRKNFVSPLLEYVLQTELPRVYKIPMFTTFASDTSESTVEHITHYLTEAGDIANNENLRLKFFANSLTKNAFTWFTKLAPHSIQHWTKLERLFHEQFYMGQSKISLKELPSVKRRSTEFVDDYLNRFILLKARCFTQVPEYVYQLTLKISVNKSNDGPIPNFSIGLTQLEQEQASDDDNGKKNGKKMEKKPDQINRGKRKQQSDDKNAKKSGKKMKKKPDQKKQQSAGEESDERKLMNLEFPYCISPSASFYSLSVTFVRLV
ncbi:uncharacterized protein [Medicago truncatula]|uniref:uncharacterized protein n=1 Tax=Medicago truncatula TaxID=3880 RepID=UPI00196754AF|nr:uncharacterized protein LOC120576983 [Medicago truncatula]